MDYLKDVLYELAYELDFYIDSEFECRKALLMMACENEKLSDMQHSIYTEEDFYALKSHINSTF